MEIMLAIIAVALFIYYWSWIILSGRAMRHKIHFLSLVIRESFRRTDENRRIMDTDDDDDPPDMG
jgi:hypothetical protein